MARSMWVMVIGHHYCRHSHVVVTTHPASLPECPHSILSIQARVSPHQAASEPHACPQVALPMSPHITQCRPLPPSSNKPEPKPLLLDPMALLLHWLC